MFKRNIRRLDLFLIVLVVALTIFGIVVIGSATRINYPDTVPTVYNAQIKWAIVAFFLLVVSTAIDYTFLGKFYLAAYGVAIVMLVAVMLFGDDANGAARWLPIGSFRLQPSEFVKVIMIFCIAKLISSKEEKIDNPLTVLMILVFTLVPIYFVYKQPSLSVSLILLAILAAELFTSNISYKYIFTVVAIVLPVFTLSYFDIFRENPIFIDKVLKGYHIERVRAIRDPDKYPDTSFQSIKSLDVLGSGQLDGKGLYKGTLNQQSKIPEQQNDFIFTVIGDEFGFKGCIIVIAMLFLIVVQCVIIAYNAADTFGRLIAVGTAGMFVFQTFVHLGVTMAFLPTTGMGLPFVSSGGSALWTNYIAIGLVLNVGLKQPKSFFEDN